MWSWRPDAGAQLVDEAAFRRMTGARKPGPRGERAISCKTIAWGMPDVSGASAVNTRSAILSHHRGHTITAARSPNRDRYSRQGYGRKPLLSRSRGRGADAPQASGATRPSSVSFLLTQCYTPAELLRIVREHWGIENVLHWTLDVVLDEDQARSRKDHAPATSPFCGDLPLNIARAHPDTKTSFRGKLKRAAWDDNFLVDMLLNMR